MPMTNTDDFMAVEVVPGGHVKMTVDMGAGPTEVMSNNPIKYGQWHQLEVDRRGYYVTMVVRSEEESNEIVEDRQDNVALNRMDEYGRPFGAVFNLHKDYSKLFVGGFPTSARIQEVVRATNMEGQIEGFKIGGKSVGLWNFKAANGLKGAPQRNKLKEQPETGLRFDGQSYLSVDRSNYMPNFAKESYMKMAFKPESSNGILAFVGDKTGTDFAALELANGYLTYSINLGSGTVSIDANVQIAMNTWNTVEVTREGRVSKIVVNGQEAGMIEATGEMDELDVSNEIFLGGYPAGQMPVPDVREVNFKGCIEEFYLGPDRVDLSASSPGAYGVRPGCTEGVRKIPLKIK